MAALPLLIAAAAYGSAPQAWARVAVQALPVYHEDRGAPGKAAELERIADAVARESVSAPRPPQEWSALALTVGGHESGLSSRIIAGRCKAHECDAGRARGFGQVHANSHNRDEWQHANGDIDLQAKLTSDALKRAYWTCARSGVPWVQGTLNAYAGRRCGDTWPGLELRIATFNRLVRVGVPKATAS